MSSQLTTQPNISAESLLVLKEWLSFLNQRQAFTGLAVHIADLSGDVFSEAFGMADVSNDHQLTPQHLFNIGSQAKLLLAVLLMKLAEAKHIDLDAPASDHVDWLKLHQSSRIANASVRNLLSHRTGLARDGFDGDFWQGHRRFPDETQLQHLVLESPVAPDTLERKYSNLGYAILGLIIERVTGRDFVELTQTDLLNSDHEMPRAKAYGRELNHQRIELELQETGSPYAAVSGIWSSPALLARLLVEIARPESRILRQSDWISMTSGEPPFGSGAEILRLRNGDRLHGHSGGYRGHRSATFVDTSGVAVSIAANCADTPVVDLCAGIFELLRFNPHPDPKMGIFSNEWSDIHLVRNASIIQSVNPNLWNPFAKNIDRFEQLTDLRLRIADGQGGCFTGEHLEFTPDLKSLRNAGFTFNRYSAT